MAGCLCSSHSQMGPGGLRFLWQDARASYGREACASLIACYGQDFFSEHNRELYFILRLRKVHKYVYTNLA